MPSSDEETRQSTLHAKWEEENRRLDEEKKKLEEDRRLTIKIQFCRVGHEFSVCIIYHSKEQERSRVDASKF